MIIIPFVSPASRNIFPETSEDRQRSLRNTLNPTLSHLILDFPSAVFHLIPRNILFIPRDILISFFALRDTTGLFPVTPLVCTREDHFCQTLLRQQQNKIHPWHLFLHDKQNEERNYVHSSCNPLRYLLLLVISSWSSSRQRWWVSATTRKKIK